MSSDAQKDLSDNTLFPDRSPPTQIIVLPHPTAILAPLADLAEQAKIYVNQSRADATRRAYANDWRDFTGWCDMRRLPALPAAPETVALYLTELATVLKVATLQRRVAAISQAHQAARLMSPTKDVAVRLIMAGIRRAHGVAQEGKAPTLTDDIRAMVAALGKSHAHVQERALLLVGFAGAFRRSELVALDAADLQFNRSGLVVAIRRSKTDQEGQGQVVGIPNGQHPETCPVRAMKAWLKLSGITTGPVFRSVNRADVVLPSRLSDKGVARAVKRGAERAGLDPSLYAGHSLRAGLATSAAAAGVEERVIAKTTRHKSMTVLRRYIRDGSLFNDNAAGKVGL